VAEAALDAQYGQTALATFRQLARSRTRVAAACGGGAEIAALNAMFAAKDFETGRALLRRKAYDPALIYLKDIVRLYPGTPAAREAHLRMVDAYRAIRYQEEIAEACADMRRTYPGDAAVLRACGAAPVSQAPTPPPAPAPVQTPTR
jgi:outer membrane protein assembly factor BamD (BamD/ComL family)